MLHQNEKKQFLQLVEKYVSGEATDAEKAFLEKYYQLHENKTEWLKTLSEDERFALEEELRAAIFSEIPIRAAQEKKPALVVFFRKYKTAVAVAAIFIIAAGSFFIFKTRSFSNTKQVQQQSVQNRYKDEVEPGREGAVLTLADGKKIVLDSIRNGSVAIQGGTEIIKKDGQVVCNKIDNSSEITYNTINTPKGRQYNLILADGSKVWLNAASSITFPTSFSGTERKVAVTGEVYFEVAHNSKMPFVVQKGNMSVNVLGTHFNINSYEDENSINVTLLEGSVKIVNEKDVKIIKPGQQARVVALGTMHVVNDVDTEEVMAWKNEVFKFKGTDIGILMRQLSRWYDVDVVYNRKVNDRFYVEVPRNTKLSDLLKALELTGRVQFGIEGKKIIVMP